MSRQGAELDAIFCGPQTDCFILATSRDYLAVWGKLHRAYSSSMPEQCQPLHSAVGVPDPAAAIP
eukprot:3023341-Rhodomonas_salina.1